MNAAYGSLNVTSGRFCACGQPISMRATTCRLCRSYASRLLVNRFWSHVVKAGPDECWVWRGRSDRQTGYGRIRAGSTLELPEPVQVALFFAGDAA